ncbi:carboxymuconolactone decarboxylase family protein [Mycobacterium avium]|uniref:carboxymuconolactone decarboxylase family protein n=1 Tax=Mycobacterium avium TaxID=1764 RepID=UPI001CC80464|nr:carboxymuconolactone decarboxylase family protein [Mycobacterium avium]MBZ4521803.1 carboxymuconolactone decarboxylase family protein [Mycobacterium avium subsp. hominissuis]MBZ4531185.1 carboxymuconolactone decarboxylase family protein [Mycobacterium avium subsp. hominissuis]
MTQTDQNQRWARGLQALGTLEGDPPTQIDNTRGELATTHFGDLGEHMINFVFGDIYSRPGLSLREREFVTISVLIALGRQTQLKTRLRTAMNVGATPQELEEVIIQTIPFAGFPTAIDAMTILRGLLAEREKKG